MVGAPHVVGDGLQTSRVEALRLRHGLKAVPYNRRRDDKPVGRRGCRPDVVGEGLHTVPRRGVPFAARPEGRALQIGGATTNLRSDGDAVLTLQRTVFKRPRVEAFPFAARPEGCALQIGGARWSVR